MTPAPNRRWFRWSLLVLLVVTAPIACRLGYELNWLWQRRQAIAQTNVFASTTESDFGPGEPRAAPSWLSLFGEPGYVQIEVQIPYSRRDSIDAMMDRMNELFPETDAIKVTEPDHEPTPRDIDGFKISATTSE